MTAARLLTLSLALLASVPAVAGPHTDALSQCLADNTSGKDRKEMAKWVFMAMSAHPEIRSVSSISTDAKDASNQSMGKLTTRLLSEDCARQTRTAVQKEGSGALEASFETLGKLAMQELMSNPEVGASFAAFEKHVDRKKLDAALSAR